MSERDQTNRRRCVVTGCNPVLIGDEAAAEHSKATGHRTANWPIRSAAGKAKARARNKSGYYDKYNTGAKARGGYGDGRRSDGANYYGMEEHPFSEEAVQG